VQAIAVVAIARSDPHQGGDMKKKSKKLTVSKETLRALDGSLMQKIAGGATYGTCDTEVTRKASNCNCSEFCTLTDNCI
jgi:hypothetical protein